MSLNGIIEGKKVIIVMVESSLQEVEKMPCYTFWAGLLKKIICSM